MTMPGDPHARPGAFTDKSDPLNKAALEFIEAMTMPSKIWAGQYPNNQSAGDWDVVKEFTSDTQYIREDIAEELARALEKCPGSIGRQALARYRAIAD